MCKGSLRDRPDALLLERLGEGTGTPQRQPQSLRDEKTETITPNGSRERPGISTSRDLGRCTSAQHGMPAATTRWQDAD